MADIPGGDDGTSGIIHGHSGWRINRRHRGRGKGHGHGHGGRGHRIGHSNKGHSIHGMHISHAGPSGGESMGPGGDPSVSGHIAHNAHGGGWHTSNNPAPSSGHADHVRHGPRHGHAIKAHVFATAAAMAWSYGHTRHGHGRMARPRHIHDSQHRFGHPRVGPHRGHTAAHTTHGHSGGHSRQSTGDHWLSEDASFFGVNSPPPRFHGHSSPHRGNHIHPLH